MIREFHLKDSVDAFAFYVDGLVIGEQVDQALKEIMMIEGGFSRIESLERHVLAVSQLKTVENYTDLLLGVLGGDTALFVEGNSKVSLSLNFCSFA